MQYVPPTRTTAGSIQLLPQTRPLNQYEDLFAPYPELAPGPLQSLPDAPIKDGMEEQEPIEDDSGSHELPGSDEGSGKDENNTEEPLMLPGTQPKTWPDKMLDFEGYPDHEQDPPADLSCYEVCQQYPASLTNDNLLPFIQRRWSGDEIFDCLPLDVQQYVHDRKVNQVTNWLFKRIEKLQNKLKGLGPSGKTGTLDFTAYLALLNGPRLRDDGRPADIQKSQSVAAPNRMWRERKGVGIDPDTGLYVEVASQPQALYRALMEAAPADALTSQVAAPNQATQLRPQPNVLRLRKGGRKAKPRGGSPRTATRAPVKTTRRGPRSRSTANHPPRDIDRKTDLAPTHNHPNSTPASGTAGSVAHDLPQAACTPPPQHSIVGSLSEIYSPTLASMFPDGMINMRGAYVRTVSPHGTSVWHGAPSAEFIENYTRDGRFRLWMDVNLPQQYDPNAPYPSLVPANEPATFRTGAADWLNLDDFDLPHEKEAKLSADREARLKRKADALPDEINEAVGQPMKKARTGLDIGEAATQAVADEATQAIMQIMDAKTPEKTADDGLDADQGVEMADNIVEDADEGRDSSAE